MGYIVYRNMELWLRHFLLLKSHSLKQVEEQLTQPRGQRLLGLGIGYESRVIEINRLQKSAIVYDWLIKFP